jgi:hypothetical protein
MKQTSRHDKYFISFLQNMPHTGWRFSPAAGDPGWRRNCQAL